MKKLKNGSKAGGHESQSGRNNGTKNNYRPPAPPKVSFLEVSDSETTKGAAVSVIETGTNESAEYWIQRINSPLERTVEAIIATGSALLEAKQALKRGEWLKLFDPGKLRIGKRSAQVFMAIAGNQALANTQNHAYLPATINSLNMLAKIEPDKLQSAIKKGQLKPAMSFQEVKELSKSLLPPEADKQEDAHSAKENLAAESATLPTCHWKTYFSDFRDRTRQLMETYPDQALQISVYAEKVLRELGEFRKLLPSHPILVSQNDQKLNGMTN
jgi:hypothetical protein